MEQCNEARCVVTLKSSDLILHGCIFLRFESSDADSDVLESAENDAKRFPLTHSQVKLFDKSMAMKRRRYIERHIDLDDTDDDNDNDASDDDNDLNDEEFVELFRAHITRKKMRKKIRANPEVPYFLPCSLESSKLQPISFSLYKTLFTPI